MCANQSRLYFFGAVMAATALASGVFAGPGLANAAPPKTDQQAAPASSVVPGGSAQSETQTTSRAAPAMAASLTLAGPSPGVDVGVTMPVGGQASAGARTSATAPASTSTASAPTNPSPTDPLGGDGVAAQLPAPPPSATHPSATQPSATKPPSAKPAMPELQATPSTTPPVAVPPSTAKAAAPRPSATPPPAPEPAGTSTQMTAATAILPVAAPASAARPVATQSVATQSVATQPVATQPVQAPTARPSTGTGASGPHQLQSLVTQSPWAEAHQAARLVPPPGSSLSGEPTHLLLGMARGPLGPAMRSPGALAASAGLETGPARVAAAPPPHVQSHKPASVARPRAGTPPPIPQALSSAPPVQTRLPVGGAAAAGGGGGVASVAPSVLVAFEALALALALATILLARFSLDLAMWRSTMLGSRLEHPG
jgi:hypothetical protein